jgi:hypothetical protein
MWSKTEYRALVANENFNFSEKAEECLGHAAANAEKDWDREAWITTAQVYATLALAEQTKFVGANA